MSTLSNYSDQIDFSHLQIDRQKDILKADAFNVMLRYLVGKYDDSTFLVEMKKLAHHSIFTFQELMSFLKPIVRYEAYQNSGGKSASQIEELKRRFMYIENL
jgi:hypothetical protein